jgi:cytoskeletal protein CcmA (bactofilin family)
MFRRREDGSEELITETGSTTSVTEGAKVISAAPSAAAAASAPSAPSAPATATAPSAPSAPAPNFRPAAPQAAMAASRSAMAPAAQLPPLSNSSTNNESRAASVAAAMRPNAKRVLTVGPDIQMKGEISSCDRVVIEGMVDATMRDVHTVELTETGALKGTAEVEDAEVSGTFEGDLTVRGKLTVYASGRIRGNVTYGEIEIQRGGQISGNIRNIADAKSGASAAPQGKSRAA